MSNQYSCKFASPEPSNYTRIPNILSHLTYDFINPKTGKKQIKSISVYARELYRVIKDAAGDNGKCWKSREHLAQLCGMSTGQVTKAKEELCQKFHQLNGGSLISIAIKNKNVVKDGKSVCKAVYHEIVIANIWALNNLFFSLKKEEARSQCDGAQEARSQCDGAQEARSQCDGAQGGARSYYDTNNTTVNKIPLLKEQQPAPRRNSAALLAQKKGLSVEQGKALSWLIAFDCPEGNALTIAASFSSQEISAASKYLEKQIQKGKDIGKPIEKKWAYFQSILKNKYYKQEKQQEQ